MFHLCSKRLELIASWTSPALAITSKGGRLRQGLLQPCEPAASPRKATLMKKPGPAKHAESGQFGAEHRVRTGDLRLGKANRPRQQPSPLLTNHHQPVEFIRRTQQLRKGRLTNRPQ